MAQEYGLHLAQNAKEITALDNAKAMLEILKEDANKLQQQISNTKIALLQNG